MRGRVRDSEPPFRPPWAGSELEFSRLCDACGLCREACPEGIIQRGAGGLPEVAFEDGHCSFCRRCVEACPTGALTIATADPWPYLARIDDSCLEARGIVCRLCGEQCEARAISFKLAVGGRALAEIDAGSCNACGACVGVCPPSR